MLLPLSGLSRLWGAAGRGADAKTGPLASPPFFFLFVLFSVSRASWRASILAEAQRLNGRGRDE